MPVRILQRIHSEEICLMWFFKQHSEIEVYKIVRLTGLLLGLILLMSFLPVRGLVYPALQDSSHAVVFFIFTSILH